MSIHCSSAVERYKAAVSSFFVVAAELNHWCCCLETFISADSLMFLESLCRPFGQLFLIIFASICCKRGLLCVLSPFFQEKRVPVSCLSSFVADSPVVLMRWPPFCSLLRVCSVILCQIWFHHLVCHFSISFPVFWRSGSKVSPTNQLKYRKDNLNVITDEIISKQAMHVMAGLP